MKKKRINLSVIKEIMSVKDLKNTLGGSGGDGGLGTGTCGFGKKFSGGGEVSGCNLDKASAQWFADYYGGNWCCDSCSTTWYCG